MLEFVERRFDVSWHGYVDEAVGIVSGDCEATIECAGPIGGDGIESS
jgi:hypothetical protein